MSETVEKALLSYDEYVRLVEERDRTDSIHRREEVDEQVEDCACKLLDKLESLYAKYGRRFVEDSDYRSDRGSLSLDEYDARCVRLVYSDSWSYGGECCFGIGVLMMYLDPAELSKLEAELRSGQIASLKGEINRMEQEISGLRCKVAEYKAKLDQLVGETLKENKEDKQ